ncbi:MAG: 1-acyl-sn-glycerol-3-phosphate acyltransferase [Flavobacteriaceae bacterium]
MLYQLVKTYIKTGLFLFYKEIKETGRENIPSKGPILFLPNHQNGMMDPLILATANKSMYFLARASAFKNKLAAKILTKLHLVKIYRKRDGVDSKKLNESIFDQCLELLNKDKNMLIFPEGSHDIIRKVRTLRAGFTRIAFDFLAANPTKDIMLIPIGLNYDNTFDYAKSIHVIYGKPISARSFYNAKDIEKSKNELIEFVHQKIVSQTVYIDDEKNYETIISNINGAEFLDPKSTNDNIKKGHYLTKETLVDKKKRKNIFYYLMALNSIFPMLFWKWLKPKVKMKEFTSTAKYSLGLTIFPVFYFLQTLLIGSLFGSSIAFLYVILCFVLIILSTKTR